MIYDMLFWRFCKCYLRYSILIQFYFCWLCTNRAKCALEYQTLGGGNSITGLFDFILFFVCITSQSGALIAYLIEGKFSNYITLYMITMLNMVNYNTCNVFVVKHLNTRIMCTGQWTHMHYLTHTNTSLCRRQEFTQCNGMWGCIQTMMTFHRKWSA